MKKDKISGWDNNKKLKRILSILSEKPNYKREAIFIIIICLIFGIFFYFKK